MTEPGQPTDEPFASTADALTKGGAGPAAAPDGLVDTAHLRNVVQSRVFGVGVEPVRIGRFPILRTVGRGAMGAVYAAYDNQLDRKIAIKLLHGGGGDDDDVRRARILREAKALARLSHPGVVQVYEVGEHEGRIYLAMEFVQGADARRWASGGARSVAEVLEVFAQAGRGLAAAHAAGLVHRDVKPDNIVVGEDGRARMVDFGLAVEHADRPSTTPEPDDPHHAPLDRWTRTRNAAGTPAYMAAEQLAGQPADARSDQFGFAVALFEALFGRRPFAGETLLDLASAVTQGAIDVPPRHRVPAHVLVALRRALAPKPEARFPDMNALLAALAHAPQRRLRWKVVLGVPALVIGTILLATYSFGIDQMVTASLAASERAHDAGIRADEAMVAELQATVHVDPTATIRRLTELRTSSPAWSSTVWSLAQTIADIGVAAEIVELPAGFTATRFAGAHTVIGNQGTERARLDAAQGSIQPAPALGSLAPDGRWALTDADTAPTLRSLDDGTTRRLHDAPCTEVRWSPDAAWVAARCEGRTFAWSTSGTLERVATTDGELVRLDRDGGHVLTRTASGEWQRWSFARGVAVARVRVDGELVGYDDAGARAFVARAGTLAVVDLGRGELREHAIAADVEIAALAPDGRTLALGTSAGELWWLEAGAAEASPVRGRDGLGEHIEALAWSDDGTGLVARTVGGRVRVFDGAGRAARMTVQDPAPIRDVRWLADGRIETLTASSIRRWAIAGPQVLGRDVAGVGVCPDGAQVLGLASGAITRDGRDIRTVEGLLGLRVAPDCSWLAALTKDRVHVLPLDRPGRERVLAANAFVEDLAFSADGTHMAWRDGCTLHVLALGDGRTHEVAAAPGRCLDAVEIVDDVVLVADGPARARGELIRRFALSDGSEREPLSPGHAIGRFVAVPATAEGAPTLLAIASDDAVALFDPTTGSSRTLAKPGELVVALAASSDGAWLAAQPWRGALRIWHLPTGMQHDTPIVGSTVEPEALRAWMLGPLVATGPATFTVVDLDRTAFSTTLGVPTATGMLRDWVGSHVPPVTTPPG